MTLMTRFSRLFRADLHAVLDRVEEPDVLLRQAVREMEEELTQDAAALKRLEQERRRLQVHRAELEQKLGSLEEELGVCLDAGKEDLARPVMRRKLETRKGMQLLARREEALIARIAEAQQRLNENRSTYESLRQKAELFTEEQAASRQREDRDWLDFSVRDEEVEVALLREQQRRARS